MSAPVETTTPTTPAHRIFVGNLTKNVEGGDLEKTFSEFGKVLSVRIVKKKFQNNTFGFVDMEDLEAANKAVADVNGKEFDSKAVTVELARERSTESRPKRTTTRKPSNPTRGPRRNTRNKDTTSTTKDTTAATTADSTATTETTKDSTKPARRRSNNRRSIKKDDATTETKDSTATTESPAAASPSTTSTAKSRRPRRERKPAANTADRQQSSTTLFVRNIPYSFDDAKLLETFKEFNPKKATIIVNKHNQKSKGYGFVEFDEVANQQKGLSLHKHKVEDRELSVKVALDSEHTPDTATTTSAAN